MHMQKLAATSKSSCSSVGGNTCETMNHRHQFSNLRTFSCNPARYTVHMNRHEGNLLRGTSPCACQIMNSKETEHPPSAVAFDRASASWTAPVLCRTSPNAFEHS